MASRVGFSLAAYAAVYEMAAREKDDLVAIQPGGPDQPCGGYAFGQPDRMQVGSVGKIKACHGENIARYVSHLEYTGTG